MNAASDRRLPAAAFALALASLPGAGPVSLRATLEGRTPREAWAAVGDGVVTRPPGRASAPAVSEDQLTLDALPDRPIPRRRSWRDVAADVDPQQLWQTIDGRGIGVTWLGDSRYPSRLSHDPEGPPILFWRGDLDVVSAPTVAVVGTRHCTPLGRAVARDLGLELAEAGVCVVSGLALGIDGAAHRGALGSRRTGGVTAGIAASGVDVPYPRQHGDLWEQVVSRGVVVAETAPGRPAQAWRFPARNRIIAGLADIVVVVESFEAGGSLLTVDAALARGVEVRAVPGPVHSPASSGTNRLLMDGAAPIRHAGDVLDALGIVSSRRAIAGDPFADPEGGGEAPGGAVQGVSTGGARAGRPGGRAGQGGGGLDPRDRRVFEAVGWAPTLLGRIVERSGCGVGPTVASLARLEAAALVVAGDAWWVRRC